MGTRRALLLLLPFVFSACSSPELFPARKALSQRSTDSSGANKVLTVDGRECRFPFRYAGILRHHCLSTRSSRLWCSTTSNFDRDRQWGYCAAGDLAAPSKCDERSQSVDPCEDNPCANGGLCISIPGWRAFVCRCLEPFTGRRCLQEKCYEELHLRYYDTSQSWGRIHLRSVEQCTCVGGQTKCERVRYGACTSNPCQNEGVCRTITSTGEAVCACRPGFAGPHCSITLGEDCYRMNGTDYRGTANATFSGAPCLPWNSDLLHEELSVTNVDSTALVGLGEHAFCRNPDGDSMPWCYTLKNSAISWEYCDIPSCQPSFSEWHSAAPFIRLKKPSSQPPTVAPPKTIRPPSCGTKHRKRIPQPRILGGHAALPGAHPWMAAIYLGESFCAGTLIASCWVVSAAHCFLSNPLVSQVRVVLGQHHFNDTGPNAKSHHIDKYIFPDQYSVFNPTVHDIVLIKLKKKNGRCAKVTQFVRPICLPGEDITFPDYYCCEITGWGHMYEKANAYASQLMQGVVHITPFEQCSRPDVYGVEVTPSMLCAGSHRCVDACQGDSGGPLACTKNGVAFLYGIISWGDGCGRSRKPGVYTRVSNYVKWIKRVMKSKS
ncbi:hepatocyte growth factor activator isoform X1 [Arapaima gigas]